MSATAVIPGRLYRVCFFGQVQFVFAENAAHAIVVALDSVPTHKE